jgi:uncharacterized protein YjbI with pentapeptide repeats
MRSTTVDAQTADGQQWDDDLYKFCTFENFAVEGKTVSGDFIDCTFKGMDWYWGFFSGVTFLRCHFGGCTFSGCSFTDARFVECSFEDCRFVKDNLGGDCDFAGAIAYGCDLRKGCVGFELQTFMQGEAQE